MNGQEFHDHGQLRQERDQPRGNDWPREESPHNR